MSATRVQVGQVYGRLTVLGRNGSAKRGNSGNYPLFVCKCVCGHITSALSVDLYRGKKKSCGCLLRETMKRGQAVLAARRLPKKESAVNALFRYYAFNADRRNFSFSLQKRVFERLILSSCNYCGAPPLTDFCKHGVVYMRYNGIDRLDNSRGYTVENTVSCCAPCNKLKGAFNRFEFLDQVSKINSNMRYAVQHVGFHEIRQWRESVDKKGKTVALSTGCFDVIHVGHLRLWAAAKSMADLLIVGINSDQSVRILKGTGRPVNVQHDRAFVAAAFDVVDHVTIFPGQTVTELIAAVRPTFWIKGGDYTVESLNQDEVAAARACGCAIKIVPFVHGYSTTSTLEKIK